MSKTIEVKVLEIKRFPPSGRGSYKEQEVLAVVDEYSPNSPFTLVRFRHDHDDPLYKDGFYKGEQIKATKINKKTGMLYNDEFEGVVVIEGFNGVELAFDPARKSNSDPADERQKSILIQSDLRTTAILIGCKYDSMENQIEDLNAMYKKIKAFREAEMEK